MENIIILGQLPFTDIHITFENWLLLVLFIVFVPFVFSVFAKRKKLIHALLVGRKTLKFIEQSSVTCILKS